MRLFLKVSLSYPLCIFRCGRPSYLPQAVACALAVLAYLPVVACLYLIHCLYLHPSPCFPSPHFSAHLIYDFATSSS